MLIFDGPLQVLFYALPPNSHLLFSKPGIGPLFEDFDGPVEPRGCVESKSWIKKCFKNMILWGGPFYKEYLIFDFWFSPLPGPWGTRLALGVRRIKKLHKTRSDRRPILGGPFHKNIEITKFWSAPRPASPSGPVFSGHGPKLKIPLSKFCSPRGPDSEKVRHDPPAPKPPEEIHLAETRFLGDTQKQITSVPLQNFFFVFFAYMWGVRRETLQTLRNFYLFTLWRITPEHVHPSEQPCNYFTYSPVLPGLATNLGTYKENN